MWLSKGDITMQSKFFNKSKIICIVLSIILIITSLFSINWAAPKYSSPEERKETIEYLDAKRNTVLTLTTAATTASTALTLLKDDWATPIANELAELSGYFMIILAAITLEKFLVTLSGLIVFKYIVPIACVLLGIYIWFREMEWTKNLAVKLLALGLVLFLIVPSSVEVCQVIESTYDTSIQAAITSAENAAILAEKENKDSKNPVVQWFTNITETVTVAMDSIRNILNNFVEAIAVMIITSCVIPILMIVVFLWLINTLAGLNITFPKPVRVRVEPPKVVKKLAGVGNVYDKDSDMD